MQGYGHENQNTAYGYGMAPNGIGHELAPQRQAPASAPKPLDQLPRLARDTTAENPWPVSVLSQKYHDAVERWPASWVEGQIVEINMRRSTSGFITLRDNEQDISMSVMGYSRFVAMAREFRQGERVVIHGKPNVWPKQTRLSFVADDIRRVGAGDLKAQIDDCLLYTSPSPRD